LDDDTNIFLSEDSLHNKQCMAQCVMLISWCRNLFKLLGRIAWMDPWAMPTFCSNSAMVILQSDRISCHTSSIISFVLAVKGVPLWWSSSNVSCQFLIQES
jgi:hypothetical protein